MIGSGFLHLPTVASVFGKGLGKLVLAVRTRPVKKLVLGYFPVIGDLRIIHFEDPVSDALEVNHNPALLAAPHLVLRSHLGEANHALWPYILFVLFTLLVLF